MRSCHSLREVVGNASGTTFLGARSIWGCLFADAESLPQKMSLGQAILGQARKERRFFGKGLSSEGLFLYRKSLRIGTRENKFNSQGTSDHHTGWNFRGLSPLNSLNFIQLILSFSQGRLTGCSRSNLGSLPKQIARYPGPEIPPPPPKNYLHTKIPRNYLRGHCDNSA